MEALHQALDLPSRSSIRAYPQVSAMRIMAWVGHKTMILRSFPERSTGQTHSPAATAGLRLSTHRLRLLCTRHAISSRLRLLENRFSTARVFLPPTPASTSVTACSLFRHW